MPRCRKRRVCQEPLFREFCQNSSSDPSLSVIMTVDEYETIRLIDKLGLSQEQCADLMNVARTTAQLIYNSARKKLADCICEGKTLIISGGNYSICDGSAYCPNCTKAEAYAIPDMKPKGDVYMRIAVTYDNGTIFQHFGHTETFKFYDVNDGIITNEQVVSTNGQGHGALGGFLRAAQVDALICGGIGGGAKNALASAGIALYGGVCGNADEAVKALLQGTLGFTTSPTCNHHGEGHVCGDHSDGHQCGDHGEEHHHDGGCHCHN